jgi:hypothetical protein
MRKVAARALEAVTFLVAVWALFNLGPMAGALGFLFFLFVAYELKQA